MLGTDARKENVCVPGQPPCIGNRQAQNFRYLLVGKLVVRWREQHEPISPWSNITSINPHSSRCAVPRSWWSPHDDVIALLQASHEVIGDEFCQEIIAMPKPPASGALKCKAQGETKLVRIGG